MPVAHPLTGSPPLPVPPAVLAAAAVVLAALVLTRVRGARGAAFRPVREPRALWVTRAAALLLVLGLLAVARAGPVVEPRNLAAIAVVHLLWPGLIAASVLAGPLLWRAVDPWRALGSAERLLGAPPPAHGPPAGAGPPDGPGEPAEPGGAPDPGPVEAGSPAPDPSDGAPDPPGGAPVPPGGASDPGPPVWAGVVTAGGWVLFLAWYAVSAEPRALAAVVAAYAVVMLAGCVAVGRDRWLPAADGVGLVVSWAGLIRRGRLIAWSPPRGAAALLGAVFGGVVFARLRLSELWGEVALRPDGRRVTRLAAVAAVAGCAALAYAAERWAGRRGAPGSVAAGLVPVVAATVVALPLRRFMVAAQLLPGLATDPFDRGWRLLGGFGDVRGVDVNPWGTAVQQSLSLALVTLGALAAAYAVARRVRAVRARDPASLVVYVTTFVAALIAVSR